MADQSPSPINTEAVQLGQARVPLEDAEAVFETPDASGRTPIVVIPTRSIRLRFDLLTGAFVLLLIALFGFVWTERVVLPLAAIVAAAALGGLGTMSAFRVRVPEGTSALLMQGGRHRGILGPGTHVVMPWIAVSHLATRRQIPFELARCEAPTRDNVTASLDVLLTFTIADPARFVYAIAAPDFDLVMQAAGHDGVRTILRGLTWPEVLDLGMQHSEALRARIEEHVERYGVQLAHLNITYARPNAALLASEESRQLAITRRAEAAEEYALAERRLANEQALVHVRLVAAIERQQERLRAKAAEAEMHQHVARIEADALAARLQRLEELLTAYPHAATWDWQRQQLEVLRALASNTRAVVHFGQLSEVMRALVVAESDDRNHLPR